MKTLKFLNLALALSLVSFAVVSCGDDKKEPTAYDMVAGSYSGTMTLILADPEAQAAEPEAAAFDIKGNKIVFESFPLLSIVTAVVGEELAPATIAAVGPIPYEIAFTAAFNETGTEAALTLDPKEFTISMTDPAEEVDPKEITIKVTISAKSAGKYTPSYGGSNKLAFSLSADKILMNDVDMGLPVMTLDFDMNQK